MISRTGGAVVGILGMSWPFGSLYADERRMRFSALFFGPFVFAPNELIKVEPYWRLFGLIHGVRIVHDDPKAPRNLGFFPLRSSRLLRDLKELGYPVSMPDSSADGSLSPRGGFPLKLVPTLAVLLVWNLLFLHGSGWTARE